MHFRLRLLLLVALAAGATAAFSGAAAAEPTAARGDDLTIIIRPVQPAPATTPPAAPPVVEEPAPVLSPQPDVSKEWVVTQSGRFQALPEDASPAAVDAAVAAEPEVAAVGGALARHGVDAIFPVATSDPAATAVSAAAPDAAPQRESAAVADRNGAVKLQAANGRDVARERPADASSRRRGAAAEPRPRAEARQSKAKASHGSRAKSQRPGKRAAASKVSKKAALSKAAKKAPKQQQRTGAAKKPTRSKDRASSAKQRRQARAAKASARRQAHIRRATARVKRALRATAARRRARIPAPSIIDVPVTKVRDIVVHRRIAGRTAALLAAADRADLRLNGWGYRSTQRQIQLRRQHCGKSRYAMFRMPSGRCWPPTAPPGKSMHERGLAIDFYVEGRKGRPRPIAGTREFRWLKRNAARYGFYNLPSEAWHWSVNGR